MLNATNPTLSQVLIRERRYRSGAAVKVLALLLSILVLSACDSDPRTATAAAQRVTNRNQLIGGPTGLGEVGDYLLENDQIRLVIQDLSFNRGSGIFGGSLIDADLVRADANGTPMGGTGRDSFGELFPAFFLEMIDPENIEIINDGSDGKAAIVEVQGRGGEFITMLRFFNQAMVNSYKPEIGDAIKGIPANSDGAPLVKFATRYILEPGARHVRIESTITNNAISGSTLTFPNQQIGSALQGFTGIDFSTFTIPAGHVIGFGARNKLFAPGIGFDLRFGLEAVYQKPIELPALPGHITDLLATTSNDGLSYGFASAPDPDSNFIYRKKDYYGENVQPDDMLLLFYASGFAAAFTSELPPQLAPAFCVEGKSADEQCAEINAQCQSPAATPDFCEKQNKTCLQNYTKCLDLKAKFPSSYTFTNYFIVGDGDVASIRDEHYRLKNKDAHLVQGRVVDQASGTFATEKLNVLIYKADQDKTCQTLGNTASAAHPFSQALTDAAGNFQFRLEAGDYCYRVAANGRPTSDAVPMNVSGDTHINPVAKGAGRIQASVVDSSGQPIPAKMTVVGSYIPQAGKKPHEYLFDLAAGESWRTGEFVYEDYDENDLSPRRFIETITFADASGKTSARVPPGKYTVYFSRGTEYELDSQEIEIKPGSVATISATLKRSIKPTGYMSGDFHMHALGSIDSGLDYNTRVVSIAAEGVDLVVATDHNYISDYEPYILGNQLSPWLKSVIGLELTTFEGGHFNGFPLKRDISSMNRGSMQWQERPPQELFDTLREAGKYGPEKTIVQVNHPRDSLLGYFSQHNVDGFTSRADLKFKSTAPGTDTLIATVTAPSGPGFIKPCEDNPKKPCSTFSWDFDVIEVFNGKRLEMLHHFRMPYDTSELPPETLAYFQSDDPVEQEKLDEQFAALPPKGTILCDKNQIAFPGGLDDWYNTLNYPRPDGTYRRYAVTGNSDSHDAAAPGDSEPGYPRNYFYVGHNDVEQLTDLQLVDAIQNHHMIVTNGPFINMEINSKPLGSTITTKDSKVAVTLRTQAASWVGDNFRYKLIANGETVREGKIELKDHSWEETLAVDITGDTWFVVEVSGDQNLFPVITPDDQGRTNIDAAVGSLSSSFGLGGGVPGLKPNDKFHVTPFAFTNPIWVVQDQAGTRTEFVPPAPPPASCRAGVYEPAALRSAEYFQHVGKRLDAVNIPHLLPDEGIPFRTKGAVRDLRMFFELWGGHAH